MSNINDYIKVLPCFKLGERSDILRISLLSRLFLVLLQYLSNLIINDHDAGVFSYLKSNRTITLLDVIVENCLNGFLRWDAQYFMHITKYGYTYENTLAFFPLYPVTVRIISSILGPFMPLLNEDSIILITFVTVNIFTFVIAALALYDLTDEILGRNLAYKTAVLFCFNPASIFFSAPYTECLFSYLTFKSLQHLHRSSKKTNYKDIIIAVFYISLSTCTRSNGILNVGFLIYSYAKSTAKTLNRHSTGLTLMKHFVLLTYFILLCFVPFALLQSYNYFMFCKDFQMYISDEVANHAKTNGFVLPGNHSFYKQEWCDYALPLSYSYVQNHYWNVGFMNYYELKQIPNFLLALPMISIILINGCRFYYEHWNYCLNLGIFNVIARPTKRTARFEKEMFVYVCHALLLTVFCTFCVHVQVTTRMICSASPVCYWFCAYYYANYRTKQKIFFLDVSETNDQTFVKYYFIGYYFVGTFMFCNFLPWT